MCRYVRLINSNKLLVVSQTNFLGNICCVMGEERGVYRVLVGKPEGRRSLERPGLRWVDNIRMDL